jgi:hypothetical protein
LAFVSGRGLWFDGGVQMREIASFLFLVLLWANLVTMIKESKRR